MYQLATAQDARLTPGKIKSVIPATAGAKQTLAGWERLVLATANTATGDYTLELAAPALWAEQTTVVHVTIANAKTVTLGVQGGNPPGWTDFELNVDDYIAAFYSDGVRVHVVRSNRRLPIEIKTTDYTLTLGDSGKILVMNGDDKKFSLPATAEGLDFTFIVGATSTATGLSVSPAAADKITGNGLTAVDNKDIINTQATEKVGDMVRLAGDGVDGYYIVGVIGTWAAEA